MELRSNDFENNGDMPSELTCEGQDISPHLAWSGAPEGTKSFAVSCIDPDAPMGDFVHWLVCNIPANVNELQKGEKPPGLEIENDFGKPGYGGPCPPSGKHRYFFVVYALDVEKLEGVTKENFLQVVGEHTIDRAELVGLYQKKG